MKTKRNYTESLKLSTNEFELFDNTHENIMNFFKQDKELFDSAVETGKDAYGESGGYRENDKYVVIDKEHPFGTALYSTSDEEVVNVLRKEYDESSSIKENVETSTDIEIFDILGIEEENRESSKHLISQYRELQKKFPQASIWLKGDVDIYVHGKVVGETEDLSAVEKSVVEEEVSTDTSSEVSAELSVEEPVEEMKLTPVDVLKKHLNFEGNEDGSISIWVNGADEESESIKIEGLSREEYETLKEVFHEDEISASETVEEGGHNSGNFKSGAQRYNDRKDKIFATYDAQQAKYAKFLLDHGVSSEEVEKLKRDSGLGQNPLAKKYFELKKSLKEEVEEPELPTTLTVDVSMFVDGDIDLESTYLDDAISDWLSDEYGFCHFGFDYEVEGDKIRVYNIAWDTSDEDSLEESIKLNESTGNFGTNDVINLCSPYLDSDNFEDYKTELKDEEPEITDSEMEERIADLISQYYDDWYDQVKNALEEVDEYAFVRGGYYKGFYIDFNFDNGKELAENWFYYDKDYAVAQFKKTVETIRTALKTSVEDGLLVGYDVAFRMSNGETGYSLNKNPDSTLKSIDDAMNVVLEEGMKAIEEEYIDEVE